ncbi:hypothetical protein Q5O89_11390 [Peribacillus frigoritolerans]|nr:hypothetical protein [Peribacillus frigoritolerans]
MKKFATLLPKDWLAGTPQTLFGEEAWQTVGGKLVFGNNDFGKPNHDKVCLFLLMIN